ncbi:MAG: large subunit ribosomal protein [Candidatus Poribacteria bacterium]|nr:large subunit ribosomal protein [Candidatus Poribacteria bacterium]
MPTLEKQAIIDEISDKLGSAKMAILTEFQGLNVAEMTELRKTLRKAEIDYKVYKNTLVGMAAQQLGITGIDKYLVGSTALAIIKKDELASPTKLLKDFSAKHQNLKVKAGILNNKVIAPDGVISLINMPTREVLISMVLGGMKAPMTKLMGVLQAPIRDFMSVLKNLADKMEKGTGASVIPEIPEIPDTPESENKVEESSSDQQTAENQ